MCDAADQTIPCSHCKASGKEPYTTNDEVCCYCDGERTFQVDVLKKRIQQLIDNEIHNAVKKANHYQFILKASDHHIATENMKVSLSFVLTAIEMFGSVLLGPEYRAIADETREAWRAEIMTRYALIAPRVSAPEPEPQPELEKIEAENAEVLKDSIIEQIEVFEECDINSESAYIIALAKLMKETQERLCKRSNPNLSSRAQAALREIRAISLDIQAFTEED